jgi:hypothetical protein
VCIVFSFSLITDINTGAAAQQYVSRKTSSSSNADVNMDIEPSTQDLGWKATERRNKRRISDVTLDTTMGTDREVTEERRQLAVVCLFPPVSNVHHLTIAPAKPFSASQRTLRPSRTRHTTPLRRTRIRDAEGAYGQRRATETPGCRES